MTVIQRRCWNGVRLELEFLKETSDNYWDETQAMRIGDCGEAPPLFLESVSPGSSCKRVDSRPEKERNMILAATENKYELDLVEVAMKIQFPENEIRNHVDRTRKYNRNILAGAVSEEEDQMKGD